MDVIDEGLVDLVVNVPRSYDELGRPDGYLIRRHAHEPHTGDPGVGRVPGTSAETAGVALSCRAARPKRASRRFHRGASAAMSRPFCTNPN